MNTYLFAALDKLGDEQVKAVKGQKEHAMAGAVAGALRSFCRQSAEFSRAVANGVSELAGDKARLENQLKEQAAAHEAALASIADEMREAVSAKDAQIAALEKALAEASNVPADLRALVASSVQDAATAVGDNLNRMHGWYIKVKDSDPHLAGAIRQMVETQISQMYSKFDIDPI